MSFVFSLAGNQVTVNRGASPESKFWFTRLNHSSKLTVSGLVQTYDAGPSMLHGVLSLQSVTKAEADALRVWIDTGIRYQLKPFALAPDSSTDLGLGIGATLTYCKLDGVADTSTIITPRARPDKFDVTLPYLCKLNGLGGVGEI